MKRIFIACLLVLIASVALVAGIEYDPGYLLISYGYYTIESTLWVALLALLLLFVVVYGTFSLFRRFIQQGNNMSGWWTGFGQRRSQKQAIKGVIDYYEGNWSRAYKTLSRCAEHSEAPLVSYLLAARASNALNDMATAKTLLQKAEETVSGSSLVIGITQSELHLENKNYDLALAILIRLRSQAPKNTHVLKLIKQAFIGLNDWAGVIDLLPDLRKHKILGHDELEALELRAARAQLDEAVRVKVKPADMLHGAWKSFPKSLRRNGRLVASYAGYLIQLGDQATAEKIIRKQLNRHWEKPLLDLYGSVVGADSSLQLIEAESWLKARSNDAALMLCLGRLSLRNELWGKARDYFEGSVKLELNAEACGELGRLYAHLGEHEKSTEYFQKGLLVDLQGLPELPMPNKSSQQ